MKILAFTDPHGNLNVLQKHARDIKEQGIDCVILTGDITIFGSDMLTLLQKINAFDVPVFIIYGNHDDPKELEILCNTLDNLIFMHKKFVEFKGWWIGGFATPGLGEIYPDQEAWVAEHAEEIKSKKPLIWMDHPPPRDTKLDMLAENWHVGSRSLRKFIDIYKPAYVFCGHIHETFGMEEILEDTIIINAGPSGKIIEL